MGLFSRKPSLEERQASFYERQIALLQEQLSEARAEAQRHCDRADAAVDELVKRLGLRAISDQGRQEEVQRAEATREKAEQLAVRADMMFEEVPFGDPAGRYQRPEDALLDNDEVEVPLPPLSHFLGNGSRN